MTAELVPAPIGPPDTAPPALAAAAELVPAILATLNARTARTYLADYRDFARFLNATPGGAMPLAVCGYSSGSNLHRNLGPVADRNKQHLHGGHAQGQATPDTIDYDILAVAGASGSPVYTVRDEGNGLEAFVCAVHVTRGPIDPGTGGASVNRGCFITPAKIDWIEGRATTFGYRGPRGLSAA